MKVMTIMKVVLVIALVVLGADLSAFVNRLWEDTTSTEVKVSQALQAWQDMRLPSTMAWRTRDYVSKQWWLGPLRPLQPEEPAEACASFMAGDHGWWNLPERARQANMLLRCIVDSTERATHHHQVFIHKLTWTCLALCSAAMLGLLVIVARVIIQQSSMTRLKKTKKEDVSDTARKYDSDSEEYHSLEIIERIAKDCNSSVSSESKPAVDNVTNDRASGDYRSDNPQLAAPSSSTPAAGPKKRRRRKKNTRSEEENTLSVIAKANPAKVRGKATVAQTESSVRKGGGQNVRDKRVISSVAVPVDRRRYLVGPDGEALRQLLQEYSDVRVSVPPPFDETDNVLVMGPSLQVSAVTAKITSHLQEVEARLRARREARKLRKAMRKVKVAVPPSKRSQLIGPGGQTLKALNRKYQNVRVIVPSVKDQDTAHITVQGPKEQVEEVVAIINKRLEAMDAKAINKTTKGDDQSYDTPKHRALGLWLDEALRHPTRANNSKEGQHATEPN